MLKKICNPIRQMFLGKSIAIEKRGRHINSVNELYFRSENK